MAEVDSEKQNSDLIGRLQRAAGAVAGLGADFHHHERRLADLADRVAEGRFHLAVLGQFKRGKSTLLNALVGEDILPVGVVPLTAAPTFIEYGPRPGVENIRWSMLQNLIVSFSSFATRIKERLDETVAATKGAMEAARERRSAGQESVAQESARLGGIVAQLEKLKSELGKGAVSVNSPN